jgi:FAD/FMN-containing dehydrogenase
LTAEVRRSEPRYTDLELSVYGHVGDGDLHYNVLVPPEVDRIEFTKRIESGLSLQLYDTAAALGGTFSAEHGVGRFKKHLFEPSGGQSDRALSSFDRHRSHSHASFSRRTCLSLSSLAGPRPTQQ